MRLLYIFALALLFGSSPFAREHAFAQTMASVSPQLAQRASDVLRLLQGEMIEEQLFDENFRNAVPPEQFRALTRQVVTQQGQPLEITSITPRSPNSAVIKVRFERSIGTINIDLENAPPHRLSGLLLTGFEAGGNSLDEVMAAIDALPGRQGVLVQRLDGSDRPPGISQNWPDRSPVTLHTLATLMISISDNSATDTLIRVIGQDRLAGIVKATGHHKPEELRPFLMTRQASALKMPVHANRRAAFLAAGPAEREDLLAGYDSALTIDSIDPRILPSKPRHIDQDYFGYKGGSEPGVLSYNLLLRSKTGKGYAVSVNWNNNEQSLQESDLLALATRLASLLAEQ